MADNALTIASVKKHHVYSVNQTVAKNKPADTVNTVKQKHFNPLTTSVPPCCDCSVYKEYSHADRHDQDEAAKVCAHIR
jgi:hypothetical protein